MIEGIEALCDWMRDHAHPFYKIYYGSKGLQVLAYNDTTNDIEQAVERMRKAFSGFADGRYFIQCRDTLGASSNKGLPETIYIHSRAAASAPSVNGIAQPSASIDIQAEITKALNEYKREQEIERLKAELAEKNALIRELEGNTFGNRIGRVIEIMEPYIPKLMDKAGIQAAASTRVAVAGAAASAPAQQQVQEDGQRLTHALEQWAEADPSGYLEAIETLSHFAASDKAGYEKAKPYLGRLSQLVSFL